MEKPKFEELLKLKEKFNSDNKIDAWKEYANNISFNCPHDVSPESTFKLICRYLVASDEERLEMLKFEGHNEDFKHILKRNFLLLTKHLNKFFKEWKPVLDKLDESKNEDYKKFVILILFFVTNRDTTGYEELRYITSYLINLKNGDNLTRIKTLAYGSLKEAIEENTDELTKKLFTFIIDEYKDEFMHDDSMTIELSFKYAFIRAYIPFMLKRITDGLDELTEEESELFNRIFEN